MADRGLVTVESRFGVRETIDRLAEAAQQAGMTIFARIDHAAGARHRRFAAPDRASHLRQS